MENILQKMMRFMMPVMEKLTPSCEIISQKISRSMDNDATFHDRLEIFVHTIGCAPCRRYRKQLFAMRQITAKYAEKIDQAYSEQTIMLSDDVRRRIKHAVISNIEK